MKTINEIRRETQLPVIVATSAAKRASKASLGVAKLLPLEFEKTWTVLDLGIARHTRSPMVADPQLERGSSNIMRTTQPDP